MIFAKIKNIRKIRLSITHFGNTLYTEKSAKAQQQEGFAWECESKGKKSMCPALVNAFKSKQYYSLDKFTLSFKFSRSQLFQKFLLSV
jgi:hypothetical protein